MTKLKISLHGNLSFFFFCEYMSLWKCILLYFLSILVHSIGTDRRKKLLDVLHSCCVKYPLSEKISFFTFSKTSGWLFSALKSHLLITYLWFYVGLANFPWKNKNKNYVGLGGCLLRWINICFYLQHNSSHLTQPYQEPIMGSLALFNNCLVKCQNILFLYRTH